MILKYFLHPVVIHFVLGYRKQVRIKDRGLHNQGASTYVLSPFIFGILG